MANMSYCRFENTFRDLLDCYNNLDESVNSKTEQNFRERLIGLCKDIVDEYGDVEFNDDEDDEEYDERI